MGVSRICGRRDFPQAQFAFGHVTMHHATCAELHSDLSATELVCGESLLVTLLYITKYTK